MEKRIKELEAEAAKQPEVEFRIYFSDYRNVDGVIFPHKMTRSIEDEVNQELEIKNVKINPQIKPEKFVKK
jgi:outer membrane lipoprotein-sorting protein